MSRRIHGWDELRWGVAFTGAQRQSPSALLGEAWHASTRPSAFDGEMPRALMFKTRAQARAWCRAKRASYAGRQDSCARWRFRPVLVRERIQVVR